MPMSTPTLGWTEPLRLAGLRADPSGVQEASTDSQAALFPGMSTVTGRLRYVSLLAAARYYRMLNPSATESQELPTFLRRVEALIAACSVRHHAGGEPPGGIIGRGFADRVSGEALVKLETGLRNPPYNIYRGTLSALEVLDINRSSDPLFESARALAAAWQAPAHGSLSTSIKQGLLPGTVAGRALDEGAAAWCVCRVPPGSEEQRQLAELLLASGRTFPLPAFEDLPSGDPVSYRSVSWRLIFEIVRLSPGRTLGNDATMTRLLEPGLLEATTTPVLRRCLFPWRWVAARTLFERGWTVSFGRALRLAKGDGNGIDSPSLRRILEETFTAEHGDESIAPIVAEAVENHAHPEWLTSRFRGGSPRDALALIAAGVAAADADRRRDDTPGIVGRLWALGPVPLAEERARLDAAVSEKRTGAGVWAEIAEETLVQHVRNGLRKMGEGLPDSLLIDFDEGRWVVPGKAINLPEPIVSAASSRLDIALGWGEQLGWFSVDDNDCYALTEFGRASSAHWDTELLTP